MTDSQSPHERRALVVWVFQTGEPIHTDPGTARPMRAMNLTDALIARGHRVVLWTSAFYHQQRIHRTRESSRVVVSPQLSVEFVPSPGYSRNVGPGRLWDHWRMARTLKARLRLETVPPDVAFVGYPPVETADVMVAWLNQARVPTLLDVKDQWPTLFLDPFPNPLRPFVRVLLTPYFRMARRAIAGATGVTSMTRSFLNWSLALGEKSPSPADRVVPLVPPHTGESDEALQAARASWDRQGCRSDDGRFRVMFVGTHSTGFDFQPIREAAAQFQAEGAPVEFVLCGDGPEHANVRAMMNGLSNVVFPGWIDAAQIRVLAERSKAALAPYRNISNFTQNIPNKVVDSLSLGLPILTSLEGEVDALITPANAGMRYGSPGGLSLHDCIIKLQKDNELRLEMSKNARAIYDENFTFEQVYGGLAKHLEQLAKPRE